jgi:ribosomal protein S21
MEEYQRNNQFKKSWDNKPKREWKPKPPMPSDCQYYVEVREGEDPMRAYRKIKKKIKDDKFFEEIKERQYYQKPSFKKRERAKKRKMVLRKLQRENDDNRFMGGHNRQY